MKAGEHWGFTHLNYGVLTYDTLPDTSNRKWCSGSTLPADGNSMPLADIFANRAYSMALGYSKDQGEITIFCLQDMLFCIVFV